MNNTFLSICPRDKDYMGYNISPIAIKVLTSSGVDVKPDIDILVNDLASGHKHFQDNNGRGDSFTVDCLFSDSDVITQRIPVGITWENKTTPVKTVVDYWIRNLTPLNIVTDAVDISNGLYLITDNPSRKQTHKGASVWTLEFTRYVPFTYKGVNRTTKGVATAIKNYNKVLAQKKKKAKTKKTAKYLLKTKCKPSSLKYSKSKKVVTCVKYMQQILINKKFLKKGSKDGWFGSATKKALMKFQKKYKKKYNCKTNGSVDKNTFKALCEV